MAPRPPAPPAGYARAGGRYTAGGLLLAVPAALLALVTLVVPTGQTIIKSLRDSRAFHGVPGASGGFVGLRNYTDVLSLGTFWKAVAFSLGLAVLPLLVILLVGPALAAALDRAGAWPRRAGRLLLSVPLVVLSPVAISIGWLNGRFGGIAAMFGKPGESTAALPLIVTAATFGALCGLALLVFLPVLRGRGDGRLAPTMLAVGAITVLAALAVALQAFSFTEVIGTPRGPGTLATFQTKIAFSLFDFGHGAAIATVAGLLIGALGVAATLIAITSRLRVDLVPTGPATSGGAPATADALTPEPGGIPVSPTGGAPATAPGGAPAGVPAAAPAPRPSRGSVAVGLLVLLAVVILAVVGSWPWLAGLFSHKRPPLPEHLGMRRYLNTWIPPIIGAIVSVGAAFLAALGIGGLRPLGRRSEWLLMPFAPWLFAGVAPLSVAGYDNARRLHLIGRFAGLVPPILLSVPALVALTLFCRSRSGRWRAETARGAPPAPSFVRTVAVPALPLAGLFAGAGVLLGGQALLWPLLVGTGPGAQTAPVALLNEAGRFFAVGGEGIGVTTPIVVIVLALLALAALQIFYLDRLVITTGPAGEPYENAPQGAVFAASLPGWPGARGPASHPGPPPPAPYGPSPYAPYGPAPSRPVPQRPAPGTTPTGAPYVPQPAAPYGPPPDPAAVVAYGPAPDIAPAPGQAPPRASGGSSSSSGEAPSVPDRPSGAPPAADPDAGTASGRATSAPGAVPSPPPDGERSAAADEDLPEIESGDGPPGG